MRVRRLVLVSAFLRVVRGPHELIGCYSRWGHPFRVGRGPQAIVRYERYLLECPWLLADLHELKGLVWGCCCAPKPCHGEVLLRLANPVYACP